MMRSGPPLVDLCVQKAIDNLRYLGDVGRVGDNLLERILPHCTEEQLMHVENSTQERNLSPVTDKLWKKLYEKKFGDKSTSLVKETKVEFKWKQLYEEKLKDIEEALQKTYDRVKKLYQKEVSSKFIITLSCYWKVCVHVGAVICPLCFSDSHFVDYLLLFFPFSFMFN